MNNEILIEPINPFDPTPKELAELAKELAPLVADKSVVVGYEDEEGSGVAWVFALHLFCHPLTLSRMRCTP